MNNEQEKDSVAIWLPSFSTLHAIVHIIQICTFNPLLIRCAKAISVLRLLRSSKCIF